jgi:hypothetical protein
MLSDPVSARLKQAARELGVTLAMSKPIEAFYYCGSGAISRRSGLVAVVGWSPQRFNKIPTGAANCRVAPLLFALGKASVTILAGCPLVSQWDNDLSGRQRAHASFWRRPFPIAVTVHKTLRIPILEKSRIEFPFERSATSTMTTS